MDRWQAPQQQLVKGTASRVLLQCRTLIAMGMETAGTGTALCTAGLLLGQLLQNVELLRCNALQRLFHIGCCQYLEPVAL